MTFTSQQLQHDYFLTHWVASGGSCRAMHDAFQLQTKSPWKHLTVAGIRRKVYETLEARGVFSDLPTHLRTDPLGRSQWFQTRYKVFLDAYRHVHADIH